MGIGSCWSAALGAMPPNGVHIGVSEVVRLPVRSAPLSPTIVSGLVAIADGLAVLGSGFVIYLIRLGWNDETYLNYLSASAIHTLVTMSAFYFADLYKLGSITRPFHQLKKILVICATIFLVLVAFAFALKISAQFSRVWAFSAFLCATALICVARMSVYFILHKRAQAGRLTRNIAIVGGGAQAEKLLGQLDRVHEPWNLIIGVFDDRVNRVGPRVMGHPVLGTVDDLLGFAREHRVDDVIVTLPWSADQRLLSIANKLKELPIHLHLGSDLAGFLYPGRGYSSLGGVMTLDIADKPLGGWKIVLKELEDRLLATLLLILFAPLMLPIALGIKLESRGPALFRQPRYGFNNKVFPVFKFRTMYHNGIREEGVQQARRNDPRVTRLGGFLRRTSLDELPQLFNVLQGTMSLVGPRPHPVPLNEEHAVLIDGYFARHRVKPGITGWAQVNGLRGETDTPDKMKARVEHDIYYMEHWSLLFDLQILAKTAYVGFMHKNAY